MSLTLPILLGQQCVEGVSWNHHPNPGTLLADFPSGLIKVWGVHICSSKDPLCCPRDGVVTKLTLQSPGSDGSILCQKELLAVDVRKKLPPEPTMRWCTPSVCPPAHHSPPTVLGHQATSRSQARAKELAELRLQVLVVVITSDACESKKEIMRLKSDLQSEDCGACY